MSVEKVRAYLEPFGVSDRIREFDVSSATVELAAVAVGVEPARIAKTLSFRLGDAPILVVTAGDAKIDNSKYKHFFGMKAKMLTPEEAVERIGHAVGGVCPFALPEDVKTYLDRSLRRFDTVFPAVGSAAVGVYLALGAVGVPVFAGFSGGAGALVGMTGGYLWAFLPMAFLCGLGAQQKNKFLALALGLAGLAVCHGCGAAQFALVMSISPAQAFLAASAPYLVKDVLSLVLAYGAARAVVLALKRARLVTLS